MRQPKFIIQRTSKNQKKWWVAVRTQGICYVLCFSALWIGLFRCGIPAYALTFADNSAATFNAGTYSNTRYDTTSSPNGLDLTAAGITAKTGTFTSSAKNGTATATWQNLAWTPAAPYYKELPNNLGVESAYSTGNFSMTGNKVLLHLNESSGATTFSNTSSTGTDFTCSGSSCPTTVTGKLGNAQSFDGTADYLSLTTDLNTTLGGTASVSYWIKTTQIGGSLSYNAPNITGIEDVGGQNDVFWGWLDDTGKLGFDVGDSGGVKSTNAINDGTWHHIVMTRNAINGQVTIYVDGVQNQQSTLADFAVKTNSFYSIGRLEKTAGGTPIYFAGSVDEFSTFSRVLTATEALNMYKRGALRVKFQVKSCPTVALCTSTSFTGPSGTGTYYSELNNSTTGLPSISLSIPDYKYFQYQTTIETDSTTLTPIVRIVTLTYILSQASIAFIIRDSSDTANSNSCNLGNAGTSSLSTCSYRLKITSNAAVGYQVFVTTSGGLTNGTSTISNAAVGSGGSGGTLISAANVGTEKYGVIITSGSITGTGTISVTSSYNAGSTNSVLFNSTSSSQIISSTGQNSPTSPDTTNTILVTHNLNISGSTQAGNYVQTITYTVVPNF